MLAESNAIQRQYIRETWSRLPKEEKLRGFRYSIIGSSPLAEDDSSFSQEDASEKRTVKVPISLRGETIGNLSVQIPKHEHLTADQTDLIKAVAERVALSAENARLFEETTRRAEQERIIADISSKIGTSVRMENILRTTAAELSQLLDNADIFIELQSAKIKSRIISKQTIRGQHDARE
ncbi:GAF domain-containing protein [Candidatus Villigracilis affinis]|uniref:GAF domain-containing protein n=1 Tax=Candidatus Villigracilis affinis TaxID=3140682 RepID=UPI001DA0B0CB|nr:GAF domain-containing protein [Anaerolineales bacterium]